MLKRRIPVALLAAATVPLASSAYAQSNCAPRDAVVERLAEKYSERLAGGGLQNADTLLEVWTSEKTGSFTVLITHANGTSCVVSSGHNWNTVLTAAVPQDSAS